MHVLSSPLFPIPNIMRYVTNTDAESGAASHETHVRTVGTENRQGNPAAKAASALPPRSSYGAVLHRPPLSDGPCACGPQVGDSGTRPIDQSTKDTHSGWV